MFPLGPGRGPTSDPGLNPKFAFKFGKRVRLTSPKCQLELNLAPVPAAAAQRCLAVARM